jgi:pimeloyl-ACP methyl ester carboxylesterase
LPGHGTAAGVTLPADSDGPSSSSSSTGASTVTSSTQGSSSSGPASCSKSTTLSVTGVTRCVIETLQQAGLAGCYAFGHSAGGAVALLAASQAPDLFRAVFCFEAVVTTPATHAFMRAAVASRQLSVDGQLLGTMARKRRAVFDSRQSALQHLIAKPPFSLLDPRAVLLFVQHGLVEQSGRASEAYQQQRSTQALGEQQQQQHASRQGHAGHEQMQPDSRPPDTGAQASTPQASSHFIDSGGQQQQQQQDAGRVQEPGQQGPVQLVCAPEQEAAYYDALMPPPAVDPQRIHCPVMLAVAAAGRTSTPAAALGTHEAVRAWLLQHRGSRSSSSSSGKELHGELRAFNIELAAAMATAQLLEVPGVSHFGPLEQPQTLADSCAAFFSEAHQQSSKL